jgi:hypothetical protein
VQVGALRVADDARARQNRADRRIRVDGLDDTGGRCDEQQPVLPADDDAVGGGRVGGRRCERGKADEQ